MKYTDLFEENKTPLKTVGISRNAKKSTISVIGMTQEDNRIVIKTWHESAQEEAYAVLKEIRQGKNSKYEIVTQESYNRKSSLSKRKSRIAGTATKMAKRNVKAGNLMEIGVLTEWRPIDDPGFIMPECSGNKVGTIRTSEGYWEVFEDDIGHQKIFMVKDQQSNNIISFIGIQLWSDPYAMVKNAMTDVKFQKRGIATALIDFITELGYKLFSDFQMSIAGENLWSSLLKHSMRRIKIADIKLGQSYELSDVGTKTSDGEIILHPKNDSRAVPTNIGNLKNTEQRFVFILEKHKFEKITESKTKFGQPRIITGKGILQEIVSYGPNLDMD